MPDNEYTTCIRRWLTWQSSVQELAPDGLVSESLRLCGVTIPDADDEAWRRTHGLLPDGIAPNFQPACNEFR